jgi:hypothetical protein
MKLTQQGSRAGARKSRNQLMTNETILQQETQMREL